MEVRRFARSSREKTFPFSDPVSGVVVVDKVSMKSTSASLEFWTTDSEARPAELMSPRTMAS